MRSAARTFHGSRPHQPVPPGHGRWCSGLLPTVASGDRFSPRLRRPRPGWGRRGRSGDQGSLVGTPRMRCRYDSGPDVTASPRAPPGRRTHTRGPVPARAARTAAAVTARAGPVGPTRGPPGPSPGARLRGDAEPPDRRARGTWSSASATVPRDRPPHGAPHRTSSPSSDPNRHAHGTSVMAGFSPGWLTRRAAAPGTGGNGGKRTPLPLEHP